MSHIERKNMYKNIARARNFAYKSLKGNINGGSKGDYFTFQISKFLLLKELIIKKDSKKNTIYFNYEQNRKYLKAIKLIVDTVNKNGKIQSNNIDVIIEPEENNDNEILKSYIRDFHKIRDTFAHGAYDIDEEKGVIILANDNLPEDEKEINSTHYSIKGELPISVLELFSFVYRNPKPVYTEYEVQEYKRSVTQERSRFGYGDVVYDKAINEYNKINLINNLNINKPNKVNTEYNKMNLINNLYYTPEKFNNNIYTSKPLKLNSSSNIDLLENYNKENSKFSKDILKLMEEKERKLKLLIGILLKSKEIPIDVKLKILRELEKHGLIDLSACKDKISVNKNQQPDKIYVAKLVTVISEISEILGMNTSPENTIKVAAVYNYMQLLMAFKHEDLQQYTGEKKKVLGKLKISKLHPFHYKDKNPDYEEKKAAINKYVEKLIISKFEDITDENGKVISMGLLSKYKEHPSSSFRESINRALESFKDKLLNDLAEINIKIITSIRNSLEHGNIDELGGSIILKDRSNQNDDSTTNFECHGNPDDFYEIFTRIDLGVDLDDFTLDDFFIELKEVLDTNVFLKLKEIFEKVKVINENQATMH